MNQYQEAAARNDIRLMAMDVADAALCFGQARYSSTAYYLNKIESRLKEIRQALDGAKEEAAA